MEECSVWLDGKPIIGVRHKNQTMRLSGKSVEINLEMLADGAAHLGFCSDLRERKAAMLPAAITVRKESEAPFVRACHFEELAEVTEGSWLRGATAVRVVGFGTVEHLPLAEWLEREAITA